MGNLIQKWRETTCHNALRYRAKYNTFFWCYSHLVIHHLVIPGCPLSSSKVRSMESHECKRDAHTLSLLRHVFGKGASTVYKACLQFYSSNNGCVHSPFKAGKMQHNVTRTSSTQPSGKEECQIMTP